MRALLILFMVASVDKGGLGFDVAKSGAIYGLYTATVYLLNLPGGWIADRITGQRRAVLYGGIVIALGHFSMAVPGLTTFYLGLTLIAIGTGLLKPNISTMVGQLYGANDHRRDARLLDLLHGYQYRRAAFAARLADMSARPSTGIGALVSPVLACRSGWFNMYSAESTWVMRVSIPCRPITPKPTAAA